MTEITCFHEKLFRFEVNTLCQLPRNTLYNIIIYEMISLCSICLSGSCFNKAPSREKSTARPYNERQNLLYDLFCYMFVTFDI